MLARSPHRIEGVGVFQHRALEKEQPVVFQGGVDVFKGPHRVFEVVEHSQEKDHVEVGGEVRDVFLADHPQAASAFVPSANAGRFMADIYALARLRLAACGVTAVYGGGFCTVSDPRFYSYRRAARTGRFASLVWLD